MNKKKAVLFNIAMVGSLLGSSLLFVLNTSAKNIYAESELPNKITFSETQNTLPFTDGSGDIIAKTAKGNDVKFKIANANTQENIWANLHSEGYLYNVNRISAMTTIQINFLEDEDSLLLYWGRTSECQDGQAVIRSYNSIFNFNNDLPDYFKIKTTGPSTNLVEIKSINILYECANLYGQVSVKAQGTSGEKIDYGKVKGNGTYKIGESVTVKAQRTLVTSFDGWYDENGKPVSYDQEYTFVLDKENVNLTAKFKPARYIDFGSYPQREVDVTQEMRDKIGPEPEMNTETGWTKYPEQFVNTFGPYSKEGQYNFVKDITVGDNKYRILYEHDDNYPLEPPRPVYHAFKFSPISWKVDFNYGSRITSEKIIIDGQPYQTYPTDGTTFKRKIDGFDVYPNNYEHSDLRTFLNTTFFDVAFNELEKSYLVKQYLQGLGEGKYIWSSTEDYVYIHDKEYLEKKWSDPYDRISPYTDFTYRTCKYGFSNDTIEPNAGTYITRTPVEQNATQLYVVDNTGNCRHDTNGNYGIRPSVTINVNIFI